MLPLEYAENVPRNLIDLLEHHGKRLGVSLTALERIGQDLHLVEGFILAAEGGLGHDFARAVEYGEPLPTPAAAVGASDVDLGVPA